MIEIILTLFDVLMNIITLGAWNKWEGSQIVRTRDFIQDEDLERLL